MISPEMKHPSAYVPVAMSLSALALVIGHALVFGVALQPDDAPLSRLFEILMTAQLPVVLFFAITRLRREPKPTLRILAVQAAAALAALTADFFLA